MPEATCVICAKPSWDCSLQPPRTQGSATFFYDRPERTPSRSEGRVVAQLCCCCRRQSGAMWKRWAFSWAKGTVFVDPARPHASQLPLLHLPGLYPLHLASFPRTPSAGGPSNLFPVMRSLLTYVFGLALSLVLRLRVSPLTFRASVYSPV